MIVAAIASHSGNKIVNNLAAGGGLNGADALNPFYVNIKKKGVKRLCVKRDCYNNCRLCGELLLNEKSLFLKTSFKDLNQPWSRLTRTKAPDVRLKLKLSNR